MARTARRGELVIWANGLRVGYWRTPARSAMEFEYDGEWVAADAARPLSLSLPVTLDRVALRGRPVEAYFDNLLPDSDSIRKRLQSKFQTVSTQAFDLLAAIGRDCVGAVQLLPPDETPADPRKIEAEPLSDAALAQALAGVVSPVAIHLDQDAFRISIAGAQEKTAFLQHKGKWCRPLGATPTTHIFKLPLGLVGPGLIGNARADMTTSVENEWLCSRILAAYDIPVATCAMEQFRDFKVLVVERFDRVLHSSGKYWLRLMQEDICQATATPSYHKYEAEGGPGLADIARILQGSTRRDEDLGNLFKAQLLFWMLAATDGHAKNFSIRILQGGRYHLTPLYDVLSAWPIIGRGGSQLPFAKAKLAMALRSTRTHYRIKDIQRRHFTRFAVQTGIGPQAESMINDVLARTPRVIDSVQHGLPRAFPQRVLDPILRGLEDSAKRLEAMAG